MTQPPPPPKPNPMSLIATSISQNSIPNLQSALNYIKTSSRRGLTQEILERVVNMAVKKGRAGLVGWLIDERGAEVGMVRGEGLGAWLRGVEGEGEEGRESDVIGVLEVLVGRGWDVNGGGAGGGTPDLRYPPYPIYQLCTSEPLVKWCLDHGARVAYSDVEPYTPLLDYVARSSPSTSSSENLRVFKLLLAHGAKLGRRTLHLACVAVAGASGGSEGVSAEEKKMELVRFLVEELKCDVNGMDVPEGEEWGNHYGTPLNYVAHGGGGGGDEGVVRFLLEKGANPEIKDCWDLCDAFGYAKLGNKKVLEVLDEWKAQRGKVEREM